MTNQDQRKDKSDFIELPILLGFDHDRLIGIAKIRRDSLPDNREWVLSLGFVDIGTDDGECVGYKPVSLGLISDERYRGHLRHTEQDDE